MKYILLILTLVGCNGTAGERCYGNHTCDYGLVCVWSRGVVPKGNMRVQVDGICFQAEDLNLGENKFQQNCESQMRWR